MPLQDVLDGNGAIIQAYVPGIENVVDVSGAIVSPDVSQPAIAAPVSGQRSGWMIQNLGITPMYVNELGTSANESPASGNGSFAIAPRETIGTLPGATIVVPLTQTQINIIGANAGDGYLARQW